MKKKTHHKSIKNKQKHTNKTEKLLRMFSTEWFVKLIGRYIIIQSFKVNICKILFSRFLSCFLVGIRCWMLCYCWLCMLLCESVKKWKFFILNNPNRDDTTSRTCASKKVNCSSRLCKLIPVMLHKSEREVEEEEGWFFCIINEERKKK